MISCIPAVVALNSTVNALFIFKLGRECRRRFVDPAFSAGDILLIVRALVSLPTFGEIAEIRQLLTGS